MAILPREITGTYDGRRFELIQRRTHFDVIEYKRVEGYLLGFENGDVEYVFDFDPLLKFDPIKTEEEVKEAEALTIAIEAMKKQEPMKPKRYIGEYEHENYPICPACGACISDDNFCFKCGQKLNWED